MKESTRASLRLRATPPFDFSRSLRFLETFPPAAGEQTTAGGVLTRALRTGGRTVVFRVRSTGTVEAPRLAATLHTEGSIDRRTRAAVRARIVEHLGLEDDLRPFYHLAHADPPLADRVEELYGLHQVRFLTPFESACWSVLAQRVPLEGARKMKRALIERYGEVAELEGERYPAFPDPEDMAGATEDKLASVLGNARKARSIAAVASAFGDVEEKFLRKGDHDEVESWLRSIHGVGAWSAAFVLFRGLGRLEPMPLTEPMVRAARGAYGPKTSDARIRKIADAYGPWQGYWQLYLRATP
ncbi:MAG: DNA-3-methyladenine glycosylase 2 family protein [Actinomycetota bacterium]|nr:DNA-3-methyladenine glycosylase 2 family protein [Actinomycetota bacterium]